MKSIRNSFFSIAIIFLVGQTCAKESDEKLDEDESYVESMYGAKKEVVAADWKKFLSESKSVLAITETNFKSLQTKAGLTTDGDQKIKWNLILQRSELEFGNLHEMIELRNLEFMDELNDYDGTSGKTNADFTTGWLRRATELNRVLEEAIDE